MVKPCLWFDGTAEEAVAFYATLFPDAAVTRATPGPDGKALVVEFTLAGVAYLAINGPQFKHTEAFSLSADAAGQAEVDRLWAGLTADGGRPIQCGWLQDRFGIFWQVVPTVLPKLMNGPMAGPVFQALMGMVKPDVAALEAAAA